MPGAFEIVLESRKQLVDKIISMMQKDGFFDHADEWNRNAFRPHNPLSEAVYRGGNRIRLMVAARERGYKDPRWATFVQFRKKGYYPRKGEKGILCEKWIFDKETTIEDESGRKIKIREPLKQPKVAYFVVFNAEQIDGFPEYELPEEFETTRISTLADELIACSECPVREEEQPRAYYAPQRDVIILPPRKIFKDEVSFAKTLLHEMGHSTGHPSRLGREMAGKDNLESYAKEELRAEIGALFMGSDFGLPLSGEHYEDHSDYLKSWISVLSNDYNEFFRACADAEKIAARIEGNYERRYNREVKPARVEIPDRALQETARNCQEKKRRTR